ncbi:MAG TPA: 30S ribosomal protein S9 [Chthonomonas sp.]|uniref:30S ribosomal protein S9 n=1 Tax=Chthonomonas sp. TaxID=2282153 RepID=UPI002B4B35E2|nr:30S ribosomal protein S9 [Chthonomonas sp.]HLH80776.1 30S ribosomal protein S9 [Chthonomonas sp.]
MPVVLALLGVATGIAAYIAIVKGVWYKHTISSMSPEDRRSEDIEQPHPEENELSTNGANNISSDIALSKTEATQTVLSSMEIIPATQGVKEQNFEKTGVQSSPYGNEQAYVHSIESSREGVEGEKQSIVAQELDDEEITPSPNPMEEQKEPSEPIIDSLAVADSGSAMTEKKSRPPVQRGGRPRGAGTESTRSSSSQPSHQNRTRPEVICWRHSREWIVGIEIPDAFGDKASLEISQNGISLQPNGAQQNYYPIPQLDSDVVVQWEENGETIRYTIELTVPLLFKLDNQRQGRRVKFPSSGSYLVIVPAAWQRDTERSGAPPVTPESAAIEGYLAHFFDFEKSSDDTTITFITPEGIVHPIQQRRRFELIGNRLEDANEDMGPLFGERPPRVQADSQGWSDIGQIVIGEEGHGSGKWRQEFRPEPSSREQDLPMQTQKAGWYFIRFYDKEEQLIDSMDFRYVACLRAIVISEYTPVPAVNGHKPVNVRFLHDAGCVISPDNRARNIPSTTQTEETVAAIPADPSFGRTRWYVGPAGQRRPIEIEILIERIWWTLGDADYPPTDNWQDRVLTLSREDFAATSGKAIWIRLPKHRWVNRVLSGFELSRARPYRVEVANNSVAIPLREFYDSDELNSPNQAALYIWIEYGDILYKGVLARVPPLESALAQELPRSWHGYGRHKTAFAKAELRIGSGHVLINTNPVNHYIRQMPCKARRFWQRLYAVPQVRQVLEQIDVDITVRGNPRATMRQAKAAAHALARGLMKYDPALKQRLQVAGFGRFCKVIEDVETIFRERE